MRGSGTEEEAKGTRMSTLSGKEHANAPEQFFTITIKLRLRPRAGPIPNATTGPARGLGVARSQNHQSREILSPAFMQQIFPVVPEIFPQEEEINFYANDPSHAGACMTPVFSLIN